MQFVKCKFRPEDSRSYTYINEGEHVAVGDMVKVPDANARSLDDWKAVMVVEIIDEEPPFACKPVLGRIDPDAQAAA